MRFSEISIWSRFITNYEFMLCNDNIKFLNCSPFADMCRYHASNHLMVA